MTLLSPSSCRGPLMITLLPTWVWSAQYWRSIGVTYKWLLLSVNINFNRWPPILFLDNLEWPVIEMGIMIADNWRVTHQCFWSSVTSLSLNCLPMRRLKAKTVLAGFTTAWRFAGRPTRRSPCFVKATTDGVVRAPSEFSMTRDVLPSMIDTHEFVVPKSMPTTGPDSLEVSKSRL